MLGRLADYRQRFDQMPSRVIFDFMDREPPFWGGGSSMPDDGSWTRGIPREKLRRLHGRRVHRRLHRPHLSSRCPGSPPLLQLAAPSPLGLVAAIDYLDTVWQVAHPGQRLFRLDSAERVSKLTFAANTSEELDSRLSELGEVLRTVLDVVPSGTRKRGPSARLVRDRAPHGPGRRYRAAPRISRNVRTLEQVLLVRPMPGQHAPARNAAVTALGDLGIGYPITNPPAAWERIQAHSWSRCAFGAIREELQAQLARPSAST